MQWQSQGSFYPVTGVLANENRLTARVEGIAPEDAEWYNQSFETNIGLIGSDWKYFDMGSFTFKITEDLSYFFADSSDNVWHLVFTGFDGSSTGNAYFNKEKMGALSVENVPVLNSDITMYPNPAVNQVTLQMDVQQSASNVRVTVYNMTGQVMYQSNAVYGNTTIQLPISNWENGMYLVRIGNSDHALVKKLIKQ